MWSFFVRIRMKLERLGKFKSIGLILIILALVATSNLKLYPHPYLHPRVGKLEEAFNYFLNPAEVASMGFLVNTKACKIRNFDPYHKSALPFIKPVERFDCARKYGRLTFVTNNTLVVNSTAVENLGYSTESIWCCYKTISRISQTLENFDSQADSRFELSEKCKILQGGSEQVKSEFIKVFCYCKYLFLFDDLVYTDYHAIAQPQKSAEILKKVNFWKNQSQNRNHSDDVIKNTEKMVTTPPNILILGLDSVSRLNFIRQLKKTRKYLRQIGSIEMNGYTKVGINTFPNAVPFMTGYSEEELKKICWPSYETPMDSCPFIWKQFSAAHYLTAFLEDSPIMATFHYLKTGFVQPPMDFYLRPLMLSIYAMKKFFKDGTFQRYTVRCAGADAPYEKIFQYFENLVEMAHGVKTPLFLYSWATGLSHDSMNALQTADDRMTSLLQKIHPYLNNSILFVMGDHGYRFGEYRETPIGWFEDKLPWMSVFLGRDLRSKFPQWVNALEINSGRLLSPFDVYHTLSHLLTEFSPSEPMATTSTSLNPKTTFSPKNLGASPPTPKIPRKFGQSLLSVVPDSRNCSEAGIAPSFCACSAPTAIPLDSPRLKEAADFVVRHINSKLPPQCAPLKIQRLTGGAQLTGTKTRDLTESGGKDRDSSIIIVGFIVLPGEFRFEATLSTSLSTTVNPQPLKNESGLGGKVGDQNKPNFSLLGEILRMSQYNTEVSCVNDSITQGFCYCN